MPNEIDIPTTRSTYVASFGKIPKLGDFVRVRSTGEPLSSFEGWIVEAMASGEDRRGPQWASQYAAGSMFAFLFRAPKAAKATSVLAGVLRPSQDAVGRKFPLVVCAPVVEAAIARAPHLLPLVLGDFLEGATHALLSADALGSQQQFEDHVSRIPAPRFDGAEQASAEYTQWTQNTPLHTAWSSIYGEPYPPAVLHALYTIIEAIKPFRGQETPQTPLSVKLPLGGGGVAAAAFWIDVVRSAARWRATLPTSFWHFDGASGTILIQLGDAPTSSLLELWSPDPHSDYVCDLTLPTSVDQAKTLALLPPPVAEILQRPDGLVMHLLDALGR